MAVIDDLVEWMRRSGVPHRVTSTLRPSDPRSWHSQGLAVDFAGPRPGEGTEDLRRIYSALEPLGPDCLELIYDDQGWKNGRRYSYPESVRLAHRNHVHVAMPADWRYNPPAPTGRKTRCRKFQPTVLWSHLYRRRTGRGTG